MIFFVTKNVRIWTYVKPFSCMHMRSWSSAFGKKNNTIWAFTKMGV